jgi:predicted aminopeptidase
LPESFHAQRTRNYTDTPEVCEGSVTTPAPADPSGGNLRRAAAAAVAGACLGVLTLGATGCRPGYVARVGVQHLRFMARARPITELIGEETDPTRVRRLELVLAVREFAAVSGLDVGGSYEKVSDTSGLSTAYVVTAAHRGRLEPYVWSYPVVGRIPYRGYFERESAEQFGATLDEKGYDVYIVEAGAYSTLGWFDDPLPSGVLDYDDVALVDLVLHELVHRTVYLPGNISFNETLASAVAGRLTIRFFEERGASEEATTAGERRERWLAQSRAMDKLAAELDVYFTSVEGREADAILAGRREIYERALPSMAELGLVPAEPDARLIDRLNNAVFLALWRYRKQAHVIDAYVGSCADAGSALSSLPAVVGEADDPYAALLATQRAQVCCSETPAVSFVGRTRRRDPPCETGTTNSST